MKQFDDGNVELSRREVYLKDTFDKYLDEGFNIPDAVKRVKDTTDIVETIGGMGHTDPAFWEYLAQ